MKNYLIARIRTAIFLPLAFASFVLALTFYFENTVLAEAMMSLSSLLFIAPVLFVKTYWFLVLPYSRKQLIFWNAVEAILTAILYYIMLAVVYAVLHLRFGYEIDSVDLYLYLGITLFFTVSRIAFVSGNRMQKVGTFQPKMNRKKTYLLIPLIYAGIYIGWHLIRTIPLLLILGVLTFLFHFPAAAFRSVCMPRLSQKKMNRICAGFSLVVSFFLATFVVYTIAWAPPNRLTLPIMMSLLGRLPITLSEDRINKIIAADISSDSALMEHSLSKLASKMTKADWEERTKWCVTSACLNASAYLMPQSLDRHEKIEALYDLLIHCKPVVLKDQTIRCSGPRISVENLNRSLDRLSASSEVDDWLKSESSERQYFAIRSLALSRLSKSQSTRIKELAKSGSELVRRAADIELEMYDPDGPQECNRGSRKQCRPRNLGDLF